MPDEEPSPAGDGSGAPSDLEDGRWASRHLRRAFRADHPATSSDRATREKGGSTRHIHIIDLSRRGAERGGNRAPSGASPPGFAPGRPSA